VVIDELLLGGPLGPDPIDGLRTMVAAVVDEELDGCTMTVSLIWIALTVLLDPLSVTCVELVML
jgi:hypothetical protein